MLQPYSFFLIIAQKVKISKKKSAAPGRKLRLHGYDWNFRDTTAFHAFAASLQ